jgi:hypothetical protein
MEILSCLSPKEWSAVRDHPLDRLPPDAFSPLHVLGRNVLGEPVVGTPAF